MSSFRSLWAKSSMTDHGHTLLAHLLDVGIVAQALLSHERLMTALRRFADDLGLERDRAILVIVVLAALHDVGKASPVFQRKWPPGAPPEALESGLQRVRDVAHGTITAVFLKGWLEQRGMHRREAETLAHAIGVHHGIILPKGADLDDLVSEAQAGRAPWTQWREELAAEVELAFGSMPSFESHKGYRRAGTWAFLAGLTSVADWIGSGLPHTGPVADVSAYVASRRVVVEERLAAIGWPQGDVWWQRPSSPERFVSWFEGTPAGANPRALQVAVERSVAAVQGSQSLLIIEAPTGEGKTEAAFFASVRLGSGGGTYFGLPTRATSDALYGRLATFVATNAGRLVHVALAHGAARSMANDAIVTVAPELPPAADLERDAADPEGQEALAIQAQWFTKGHKELLAELGVGTADQALLGVLPARHHFVKLWALAGKVVVFDEVHAYDTYTGGLVRELIRWLAWLGSTVIVMSATLPDATRRELISAYQDGAGIEPATAEPAKYPRLTLVTSGSPRTATFEARPRPDVIVRAAPFDVASLGDLVLGLSGGGGAVGVIVNSVRRAQELYVRCRDADVPDLRLLHARFPLAQRKAKEAELLDRYGPHSVGRRDGVVIATQVMEQSLDVDFDVMVTDLAPIDLMLQRAGRMFRHLWRTDRGPNRAPVLYVAGLGTELDGPEDVAMHNVYDPFLLWRSWAVVIRRDAIRTDDVDPLVQHVYDVETRMPSLAAFEDRMDGLEERHHTKHVVENVSVDGWLTARPADDAPTAWRFTATDADARRPGRVVAPTRLGERSMTVVPIMHLDGAWSLPGELGGKLELGPSLGRAGVRRILEHQFSISNAELIRKLEATDPPAWWTEQRLLRFIAPLILRADGTAVVDEGVRLDNELGLVIGSGRSREEGI